MTGTVDELTFLISEVEAFRAKLDVWERAEAFRTDAGTGLYDILGDWLGQAERELSQARADAATLELRRKQSVASRGSEI